MKALQHIPLRNELLWLWPELGVVVEMSNCGFNDSPGWNMLSQHYTVLSSFPSEPATASVIYPR